MVAAILFMTVSLSAEVRDKTSAEEPCVYETIDACFHAGDWWYQTTQVDDDGYIFDLIDCGLTEGCKTCGTTSQGKPVCVTVSMDAACKCGTTQIPGAGPNVVRCDSNGACQYRF